MQRDLILYRCKQRLLHLIAEWRVVHKKTKKYFVLKNKCMFYRLTFYKTIRIQDNYLQLNTFME